MADLKGSYSSGGSPKFHYEVSYSQTKRTGSSASYRVNLKVKLDNAYSKYAYGVRAYVKINGASVEKQLKSNGGMWSGSSWQGTWTFDVTANAPTSGGTLPCEVKIWGTDGGSAPNLTIGSKTVSLSVWNTAPTWSTNDGNINGWKQNRIIAENTGSVTVNFPNATDKENNKIYYDVYRYVNDKSNAKIVSKSTSKSVTDNISNLGQGTKIKYKFIASDGSLSSGESWSYTYTKNRMTPANVTIGGSISFDTSQVSISFSGYSNTDGNNSFSFGISSPDLTIYNGTVTSNSTITVFKGGTAPSTPYVKFDDIKNLFKSSNWQGYITLNVETKNAYGTKSSKSATIKVDLRTNPNASGTPNASGQISIAGGSYFVPSKREINLSWSVGSDKLGASVTYDVQGCVKGEQWITLKSGLTTTSTSIKLEAVTKATDYLFKVITITNFGYATESRTTTITLHYYNQPRVYIQNTNRSVGEFTGQIVSMADTSITAVAITDRQYQDRNGNWQNFAGSPYRLTIGGLAEDTVLTRSIRVSDNSGQAEGSATYTYVISSYVPVFSIRKTGVAVNCLPDNVNKFKVNGRAGATAWVNKGYPTTYSGGDYVGQWTRVASFRITSRHEDSVATLDFLDSGSDYTLPLSGRIRCRVKQEDEMGKNTMLSLVLENSTNCSAEDFYLVVTTNTATQVIAELWFRNNVWWTRAYFYPSQVLGEVTMFSDQGYQTWIPNGQNQVAYELDRIKGSRIYADNFYEGNTSLADKYVSKNDGVFNSKLLTVGIEGDKKGSFGVGGSDVYIRNVKSNKYLALKDDGRIVYDNKKILTDIQSTPLWQGYHHMSKNEEVKPSKKLSDTNLGWVVCWSDWNDGGKGENFNFVYSYIPKNTSWKNGANHTFALTTGTNDTGFANKTLYIYDDKITGHDDNKKGNSYDIVIRAVYEY